MVAFPHRQRLSLPLAPLIAGVLAVTVALLFALLPAAILENLVMSSGIAALVPAAEPPLGITARAALVMIVGGGVGLVTWIAVFLAVGARSITLPGRAVRMIAQEEAAPVLRRADAHPDAPARRPLFASRDLGTPFLDVKAPAPAVVEEPIVAPLVERDLPADLDQPLAAFDPQAIPEQPIEWFSTPVEVRSETRPQVFDAGERFETFSLRPVAPKPVVTPRPEIDASASIHALLDRLEKSVARREVVAEPNLPPVRESLQESLASLRRLAMGAG